ncbi:maltotransferase domain-containing protein [Kineobactrum salinum]|uniref:Alpha-1,4-glucan:maltose-1-phosphate maltosyltransferase n=1 Tax=Kineobactrum salinum TaxID=2708301 RepID=A0A6C0U5E7_9GAMM|nr:maltotransferase domain-containing protein [Kineobactrum salinum]QIB67206.1 DUF3416 domain-containing protein [Kineobactrum salinum]
MRRQAGPRIYNLFPLLAGTTRDWTLWLPHIADMHFNWVYINPFHYPGFSGSLYAVKDYYQLNPLFDDGSGQPADQQLRKFTGQAQAQGLAVMMDLVINHTARDSLLAQSNPDWFQQDGCGELQSPHAVDPDNPQHITVWGDLAAIDYADPELRPDIVQYWQQVLQHYLRLGFRGFRCDAAYQVPAQVWRELIVGAKKVAPDALFFAETLGCASEQVYALRSAGFDFLFNSAKWWDFQAPWLLEQYNGFRTIAPSIAFPESHDTARLAADLETAGVSAADIEAHYRFHYSFAAAFSTGVMMTMGYEYGLREPLDVVNTRKTPVEPPLFDISEFIADINRMKASVPALNVEGPQTKVSTPESPAIALRRDSPSDEDWALLLVNPLRDRRVALSARDLDLQLTSQPSAFEVTPRNEGVDLQRDSRLVLNPLEVRVFHGGIRPEAPSSRERAVTANHARAARSQPIVIENVRPQIDCGKYPVKREVGDVLEVDATVFRDGHDRIAAVLLHRQVGKPGWQETPMRSINPGLDLWRASFRLEANATYQYTVEAWSDHFESWLDETGKKLGAGQSIALELIEGRELVAAAAERAQGRDRHWLDQLLAEFDRSDAEPQRTELLRSSLLRQVISRWPDRSAAVRYDVALEVVVDRIRARFASWYEMVPRSQGTDPHRGASFADCEARLPSIRAMGFDVVYLVPIHPIGRVNRKGPNNTLGAGPDDPGSPYAIGSSEGGHTAVHPELGSLEDFRHFVRAAQALDMEVALDFAIQCAPDHPWVREHPEWFIRRPDGSIKYAENPPKKYQDIVNLNFHGEHQEELWQELLNVVLFWIQQGVRIFRVDNPHTKPVPFWEWLIAEIRQQYPDVIFLSEAFTRPPMLHMLAKVGFQQSYTYFTWRNGKHELTEYLTELTMQSGREYLRPNFFPTTPDILPTYLQTGGRPAFKIRLVLAATLSSVYGMYNGYELCENRAVPGKEEYLESEKYQYKVWDWDRPGNIRSYVTRINLIRHQNPALHELKNLRFHHADHEQILFYSKLTQQPHNLLFVAVNLDPFNAHEATLYFPREELGIAENESFEVEELLSGEHQLWHGPAQQLRLEPERPAVILRVKPRHCIESSMPKQ